MARKFVLLVVLGLGGATPCLAQTPLPTLPLPGRLQDDKKDKDVPQDKKDKELPDDKKEPDKETTGKDDKAAATKPEPVLYPDDPFPPPAPPVFDPRTKAWEQVRALPHTPPLAPTPLPPPEGAPNGGKLPVPPVTPKKRTLPDITSRLDAPYGEWPSSTCSSWRPATPAQIQQPIVHSPSPTVVPVAAKPIAAAGPACSCGISDYKVIVADWLYQKKPVPVATSTLAAPEGRVEH